MSSESVTIDGVELFLGSSVDQIPPWIGQREVLMQMLAAWSRVEPADLPLNPRLLGKPGVGKTTLACAAARELDLEIYIAQATMDTRPEDLIVSPVLAPGGGIRYPSSPVGGARGELCCVPRRPTHHQASPHDHKPGEHVPIAKGPAGRSDACDAQSHGGR